MPSRKVFTNGWEYWLARHPSYGLILFDHADQDDLPVGSLRVFVFQESAGRVLSRDLLKSETSADVTDSECVQILQLYNIAKASLGKPIKAPGPSIEEKHKLFLLARGLPDNGIRQATRNRPHRVTHCWACTGALDNSVDVECATCGWIICDCGACGCGR